MSKIVFLLTLASSIAFAKLDSGTVVPNGGDPLNEVIRQTNAILAQTLKTFIADPESIPDCSAATGPCRDFLKQSAPQILLLIEGPNPTPIVLSPQLLKVNSGFGKGYAAARTSLGPKGAIELHRGSLLAMPQEDLLFLLAHEFHHKASFDGKYLSDDIGPMDLEAGKSYWGSILIDGIAGIIRAAAKNNGFMAVESNYSEHFECSVKSSTTKFGTSFSVNRYVKNLVPGYRVSVGVMPTDPSIYIQENESSKIKLRFVIDTFSPCGIADTSANVKIIRVERGSDFDKESVLQELSLAHNLMCPSQPREFSIVHEDTKFTCKYLATRKIQSGFGLE